MRKVYTILGAAGIFAIMGSHADAYVRSRCAQTGFTGFYIGGFYGLLSGRGSVLNSGVDKPVPPNQIMGPLSKQATAITGSHGGPCMGYGCVFNSKGYLGIKAAYSFTGANSPTDVIECPDPTVGPPGPPPRLKLEIKTKTTRFVDIAAVVGTLINNALVYAQVGYSNGRWIGFLKSEDPNALKNDKFLKRNLNGWNLGFGTLFPLTNSFFFQLGYVHNIYDKKGKMNNTLITLKPQTHRFDVGLGYVF